MFIDIFKIQYQIIYFFQLTEEDHNQADLSLKKTDLHISLPYPISYPFSWENKIDPCFELVREKTEYKRKLETYRHFYKKDKKHCNWTNIRKQNKDIVNLPHYIADLAIHGDKNPYFDGHYDWFYTGGCLEAVEIQNKSLLIYAQGNNIGKC